MMGMTDNDPQLNGAEEGTGVHGGASDGLPVAAPLMHRAVTLTARQAQKRDRHRDHGDHRGAETSSEG